ncbi:hypothetical protein JET18_19805 [Chryseobacterium sp. L7]|uniref:Lipoprotein n=1 Tax=Chryseobacterium endalhagicum TaxID=2797638 RepID=A0ABS1QKF5_9FLAO|nr:hypothetical protein [Chryseobacterium endalhagicum]MBL1223099.1 hypothetical protein [Chryseobacterium endalhagicum]
MKKILLLLSGCVLLLYSCKKDQKQDKNGKNDSIVKNIKTDSIHSLSEQPTQSLQTGKKPSDLVPDGYEIQYDAEGDLNLDGMADAALIVRKKEDTLARRKMLILLKNIDQTYRLYKTSDTVLPDEYNESGYKIHDPEDIAIEKGELHISLYDVGPYGNQFSRFKYMDGNLILSYIETYNMGAGSHSAMFYLPMKGKVTHETINTMEEEMPAESKTSSIKKQRFLFENASPDDIIQKVYDSVNE